MTDPRQKPKEKPTELEKAAKVTIRPTYSAYIFHLLHRGWPKDKLRLIKAHYTARGTKVIIRDLNDNQIYALEIYPELLEQGQ